VRTSLLITVRELRWRAGMDTDRLGGVELDAVAPRREQRFDSFEDQRMLDERRGVRRAQQQAAEPLGGITVERAATKWGALEMGDEVDVERGDVVGWQRIAQDAVSILLQLAGDCAAFRFGKGQGGHLRHSFRRRRAGRA
jgi:hypothetical protein